MPGMRGQDGKGLDQRTQQRATDHDRDHLDKLAQDIADREYRQKGRDRGQGGDHHRPEYLARAPGRGRHRGHAALDMAIDILRDDDRVIHDHAQHDQKGEQRDHVDRVAQVIQQRGGE